MKRKLAMILAMAMLIGIVAACGSTTDAPSTSGPAASTPAESAPAAETPAESPSEDGKIVLTVASFRPQDDDPESSWQLFEYRSEILEAQFPDIEFDWQRFAPGEDYRQQYDRQLMAGIAPIVGMQFPYVDIPTRLANGTIREITEYVTNWDLKQQGLVTTTLDQAISTRDGKWYAVPGAPYISGLPINRDVIAEAGGDPNFYPKTWAEFATTTAALTDRDAGRFGFLLLGSDWNAWPFIPWLWAAGGEWVTELPDGSWELTFVSDAWVDAGMFLNSLMWEYQSTQRDILEDWNTFVERFYSGQGVYGWGAPSWFSPNDLAQYDRTWEDMSFMPVPAGPNGKQVAFTGGEVWTMSPTATQAEADAAWEFIKYYQYEPDFLLPYWEFRNEVGEDLSNPAVRTDLVEKKFSMATSWPAHWAPAMAEAFAIAKPEPFSPHWDDIKNEIVVPLQTIYLTEGITRDEVYQLAVGAAERLVAQFPVFVMP